MKSFGWPTYPLEEICEINIGKTPSRNRTAYWGGQNKWLSISDMDGARYIHATKEGITDLGAVESNCKLVPAETVLLSFKLSIGKVAITSEPIYTNEAIASLPIIDTNRLNRDYLYWVLQGIDLIQGSDRAVMGKTLNKAKLKALQIPLPPIEEQRRIAAILDKADAIRRKQEKVLALADDFLRATFLDMFGDPNTNPKNWPTIPLEDLTVKIVDCLHTTPEHCNTKTDFPSLRTSDLQNGYIDLSSTKYVGFEEYIARNVRLTPEENDIVYSREGERFGIAALIPQNLTPCLGQRTMLFRANQKLAQPHFLWAMLNSKAIYSQAKKCVGGATSPHVNIGDIRQFRCVKPPLSTQQKFTEICLTQAKARAKINKDVALTENFLSSLSQRAFKGEL